MAISETEIPWTTARCNRLLRPIVSKLAILRKKARSQDPQHKDILESLSILRPSRDITRAGPTTTELETTSQDGRQGKHDPDWVPVAARRAVKRKYSARAPPLGSTLRPELGERKVNKPVLQPGEIVVPTPYITRTLLPPHDGIQSPYTQPEQEYDVSSGLRVQALEHCKQRGRRPNALHPKASMGDSLRSVSPARKALFDSLFDAFKSLLSGTVSNAPPRKYGARSLSSCCLRQLPAYIQLEKYWQAVEDEDDKTDTATNVYEYLEEKYGTRNEGGWKSLREVVRRHGISLFQEAILGGIIPEEMIQALVQQCIRDGAFEEAENLISTAIVMQEPLGRPDHGKDELFSPKTSSALSLLESFAGSTFRYAFLYRQLSLMLSRSQIHVEWLSTRDMLPIWSLVIRSLSESDPHYADAVRLMEATMLAGCGLNPGLTLATGHVQQNARGASTDNEERDTGSSSTEGSRRTDSDAADTEPDQPARQRTRRLVPNAFDNTFSSLVIIMSTIALLARQRAKPKGVVQTSILSVHHWTLSVVSECIVREGKDLFNTAVFSFAVSKRIVLLLTCIILLQSTGCILREGLASTNVEDCISWIDQQDKRKATRRSTTLGGNLPAFVCAIARCCGRAVQDEGFNQLQHLTQGLIRLNIRTTNAYIFVKRLALDSALAFAEALKSTEHMAFAREIEVAVRDVHVPRQPTAGTPKPKEAGGQGYRWEEGICEWIAATPAAVLKQMKQSSPKPEPSMVQVAVEFPEDAKAAGDAEIPEAAGEQEEADMSSPSIMAPAEARPSKPLLSSLIIGPDTPESAVRPQVLVVRTKRSKKRYAEYEQSTTRDTKKPCVLYSGTPLADITNKFRTASDSDAAGSKKMHSHRRKPYHKRKPFLARSTSLVSRVESDEDELSMGEKSHEISGRAINRLCREGNARLPGKSATFVRRSNQVRSLSVGDLGSSDDELSFV